MPNRPQADRLDGGAGADAGRPVTGARDVHPLVDFLVGTMAELDLTEVTLEAAPGYAARVRLPLLGDDPEGYGTVELLLDSEPHGTYPVSIRGELGVEFTRDQAIELATALLALVREHDVRRANSEYRDRRRRGWTAEPGSSAEVYPRSTPNEFINQTPLKETDDHR